MRALTMALKILLIFLAVWIVVATVGLLAAHLSGRIRRGYAVTATDKEITIGGISKSAAIWAEDFRPVMYLRSINSSPPLLRTLYEVVEHDKAVTFIYYHAWEDEVHPNLLYHRAYRLFRAAYYGSPVRDIEYFEVKVNTDTGEIDQLMFETSPGKDYNITLSEHLIAYLTRTPGGSYSMRLTRKNSDPISFGELVEVEFEVRRPRIGAITWNHLTGLVDPHDTSFDVRLDSPLQPLTDEEYAAAKFARKSHGTFKTVETGVSAAVGLLALVAVALPLGLVLRMAGWLKPKIARRRTTALG